MSEISASEDRLSKYLSEANKEMMFAELSEDYLRRIGAEEILLNVPVPIREADSEGESETDARNIVLDMAKVVGGDPFFVYGDKYLDFIKLAAGEQAEPMLVAEGARAADGGDYEDACRLLRAALKIDPKSRAALYLYARVCKACYEEEAKAFELGEGDEEKLGLFKAESLEMFEMLTMLHPEFAMGYYFLGYAYLNLGLYLKTKLTWQDFMKYSSGEYLETSDMDDDTLAELRDEISGMLEQLEEPVRIEEGCNRIMSGDYQGGKEILDEFKESGYADWWPMWQYLGIAEVSLGHSTEAEECFKRVLKLSPSNTEAMEELAAIYALSGDEENAAKYRNKIRIVKENQKEDYNSIHGDMSAESVEN